jgi:type IV pilus biogenesis protein CpaD/CtpE
MFKLLSLSSAVMVLSAGAMLGGCTLDAPTKLSQERIQVEHERFAEDHEIASFSQAQVVGLAQHYDKHGEGPMELTVTYDPQSSTATAKRATDDAARLVSALRKEGVFDVEANILPVKNSGVSKVMVAYDGYNALAPKDCQLMAGLNDRNIDADEEFKLGCSIDTLFAQQIERPNDLKGKGWSEGYSDGRRASNLTEAYRSGALNPDLKGKTATGE